MMSTLVGWAHLAPAANLPMNADQAANAIGTDLILPMIRQTKVCRTKKRWLSAHQPFARCAADLRSSIPRAEPRPASPDNRLIGRSAKRPVCRQKSIVLQTSRETGLRGPLRDQVRPRWEIH